MLLLLLQVLLRLVLVARLLLLLLLLPVLLLAGLQGCPASFAPQKACSELKIQKRKIQIQKVLTQVRTF